MRAGQKPKSATAHRRARDGRGIIPVAAAASLLAAADLRAATSVWVGTYSVNWADPNWSPTLPASGNSLSFNAAGSAGATLIDNYANLTITALTFGTSASAYTFNADANSDALGLNAGSTVNFTNNSTGGLTETFNMPINLNGGTLNASTAMVFNGAIADGSAPGIFRAGGGSVSLTASNSYSGGTVIGTGTLQLSGQATLGNTSNTLSIANAVLDLGGTTQSIGTFGTSGTAATIENSGGSLVTFTIGSGNATGGSFTGVFVDHSSSGTGTLALSKIGTGSIGFASGFSSNAFTGGASVTGGTLALNGTTSGGGVVKNNLVIGDGTDAAAVVDSGGVMHFTTSTNITVNNNGSLLLASTETDSTKTLTVNQGGYVDLGGGTLELQITANAALNMTAGIIQDGTVMPQNDGSINITAAPATSVISANMLLTGLPPTITVAPATGSNAPIGLLLSGTITSTNIGMLKVGSGILKITGSNSYGSTGGATTISAGTLLVDNASGSGTGQRAVTVNGGGTLGGIGTIGGVAGYTLANVTAAGSSTLGSAVIAPGDTNATTGAHVIGQLTIGNTLNQLNSGTLGAYSLLSVQGGPNNTCDELVVNGTLTLTSSANGAALALSSPTGTAPGTYVVASFGTLVGTFNSLTVDGVSQSTSEINYDHTADDITVTVTPEPTGAAALIGGLAMLARRRRRSLVHVQSAHG